MTDRSTFGPLVSDVAKDTDDSVLKTHAEFIPASTELAPADLHTISNKMIDQSGDLNLPRRWRVLQMIMQCSRDAF